MAARKELRKTDDFAAWLDGLRDVSGKARIVKRLMRLEEGNAGDHAGVGEGVMELRLHFGPGYRVYYVERGAAIVVLLAGGDKDSQADDIARAKRIARELVL